jgi:hypothetical protein
VLEELARRQYSSVTNQSPPDRNLMTTPSLRTRRAEIAADRSVSDSSAVSDGVCSDGVCGLNGSSVVLTA